MKILAAVLWLVAVLLLMVFGTYLLAGIVRGALLLVSIVPWQMVLAFGSSAHPVPLIVLGGMGVMVACAIGTLAVHLYDA